MCVLWRFFAVLALKHRPKSLKGSGNFLGPTPTDIAVNSNKDNLKPIFKQMNCLSFMLTWAEKKSFKDLREHKKMSAALRDS